MSRRPLSWFVTPVVILLLGATAAHAEEVSKHFIQAQQLIYLERYDQALQLVESVVPQTEEQWQRREALLTQIYRGQKDYMALEHLALAALERRPNRPDRGEWLFLRAELYLKAGRTDSGQALLDSLWRADPTDSTILRVTQLYQQHALSDWALATYLDARALLGDTTRFALELAALFESRRDYAHAATEYFNAIGNDSTLTRTVENRILQLVQTEEGGAPIEAELTAAARKPALAIPANRLLTTLYLETGRPDLALRAAWLTDSLTGQKGLALISFLRLAGERGYHAAALRAARMVVERYPNSPLRAQAEWELAHLAELTGDYAEAEDQYRRIAEHSPVARFRSEARLALGDLQRDVLGNLTAADSSYRTVLALTGDAVYHAKALLGLAVLASMHGDFDSARTLLVALSAQTGPPKVRAEVAYRLAELAFFTGDLEGALEGFNGVSTDFPKSRWVNDALRRALILTAYREVAFADVKALGRAEAFFQQRLYDSALVLLAALRTTPEAPLAPAATLLAAQICAAAGEPDSALALWDRFVELYPQAPDAPLALTRSAVFCDRTLHQPEQALARYRRLLEQYPRSHYAEEARDRVRDLTQF